MLTNAQYNRSKLELNLEKVELEWYSKIFMFINIFISCTQSQTFQNSRSSLSF